MQASQLSSPACCLFSCSDAPRWSFPLAVLRQKCSSAAPPAPAGRFRMIETDDGACVVADMLRGTAFCVASVCKAGLSAPADERA